jgi:KaiC/GvpD/RAD55 family RecA-like ATPase
MATAPNLLSFNAADARKLFELLDHIHLVAILPDPPERGGTEGRYFGSDIDGAVTWAGKANENGFNVYWTANYVAPGCHKKPAKPDIQAARLAHCDVDPPKDGSAWDKRGALVALTAHPVPPSLIIDSGNGVQPAWLFADPAKDREAIETINIGLRDKFGEDGCWNIDRLLRVPGTVNFPGKAKRQRGCVPCMASWVQEDTGQRYEPGELAGAFPADPRGKDDQRGKVDMPDDGELLTADDLEVGPLSPIRSAIDHPPGRDNSGDLLACARLMANAGYSDGQIFGVLYNQANAVSAHAFAQRDPRRAVLRVIEKVRGDGQDARRQSQSGDPGWTGGPNNGQDSRKRRAQTPLPLEWCGDITPQLTGLWLVKRLLPAIGLVLIYGHPGSGKSFLALDIAFHVALGWDWCGRKVKQGMVIYVGAEGLAGLRNRIVAFRQHYGIDDDAAIPLGLVPTSIDLQAADADTPRLIELIREAAEHSGHEPALIIVDTLSKTFGAGKENTDDMATYVANCGRIAQEFECCVMPVHHRPKDAESTEPRGHGSLKGGMDTVILVEAGLTKKATVTKQKDGETGDKTLFTLLPVQLGIDEDGEDVTSCVLQHATVDMNLPADPIARARAKLSDKNKVVLAALGKALEHDGEAVPAEIPDTVINRVARTKVAQIEAWRTRALSGLRTGPDTNPDSDRRTFDRSKMKLQSLGIIGVWEGFAWEM